MTLCTRSPLQSPDVAPSPACSLGRGTAEINRVSAGDSARDRAEDKAVGKAADKAEDKAADKAAGKAADKKEWGTWQPSRPSWVRSIPQTWGRPTCTSTSSSSIRTCSRTTRRSGAARTTVWPMPSESSRPSPRRESAASPTPPSSAWAATSPGSIASRNRCPSSTSSPPPVATPTTRSPSSSTTGGRRCRPRWAWRCRTRWWTCSSATSPTASPARGSRPPFSSAPSTIRA